MKSSAITVPVTIKNTLAFLKADMGNLRRVTWGEVLELLHQSYITMEQVRAENRRLQDN